ncbi:HAD family hydrolase [Pandoraea terrae]|uniref:HAD family hydrolase n=1 Tax=Pandoraea terrae TaxID=1537710 RepID=A0A5E4RYE1_9BURK|nr:HAD-IB family hydrolase [Pandoraea terrae]VVD68145.1 HAD family hydrolase [Pandoraea terrae]
MTPDTSVSAGAYPGTPQASLRTVAAFDFDGTITTTDSLQAFLKQTVGWAHYAAGILTSLPWLAACGLRLIGRGPAKARLLRATVGGWPRAALVEAAQRFVAEGLPALVRPEMLARIDRHRALGHRLVLVSASPSLYLEIWARSAGFDAVLATELAYADNDSGLNGSDVRHFNGRLASPNCWGPEKVRRLRAWWGAHAPEVLYVYGDSRGDREMAALTPYAWIRGQGEMPALPELPG